MEATTCDGAGPRLYQIGTAQHFSCKSRPQLSMKEASGSSQPGFPAMYEKRGWLQGVNIASFFCHQQTLVGGEGDTLANSSMGARAAKNNPPLVSMPIAISPPAVL
jgi:hypothetical protein